MRRLSFTFVLSSIGLVSLPAPAQVVVGVSAQNGANQGEVLHVDPGVPLWTAKAAVGMAADDASGVLYLSTIDPQAIADGYLWAWKYGSLGAPVLAGKIVDSATSTVLRLEGLAWADGKLFCLQNNTAGPVEGIYEVDLSTLTAKVVYAFPDTSLDCGGLGYDPATKHFYCTNDGDAYWAGRGILEVSVANQTEVLIAPYPAGVTDVDGCAVDPAGRVFLIEDEPGKDLHTWDLSLAAYDPDPPPLPVSAVQTFSSGAWAPGLFGPIGTSYCSPANSNSTGLPGIASGRGLAVSGSRPVILSATQLPPNEMGYFILSRVQGLVANPGGSQGNLCLGGTVGRLRKQVTSSGSAGRIDIEVDIMNVPRPGPDVPVLPGETWHFQAWFTDTNPGPTSNFTDGISITFQ